MVPAADLFRDIITPEMRLLAAILCRTIQDINGSEAFCSTLEYRDAVVWARCWEDDDYLTPWSFPWVCQGLNLCPVILRDAIFDRCLVVPRSRMTPRQACL